MPIGVSGSFKFKGVPLLPAYTGAQMKLPRRMLKRPLTVAEAITLVTMVLFIPYGCATGMSQRGKIFQMHDPNTGSIGLQIDTPTEDWCQAMLMSVSTASQKSNKFVCTDTSASDALNFIGTVRNNGSVLDVETSSIDACRKITDAMLRASNKQPETVPAQKKGVTAAPNKGVTASEPPKTQVEVLAECHEKATG